MSAAQNPDLEGTGRGKSFAGLYFLSNTYFAAVNNQAKLLPALAEEIL